MFYRWSPMDRSRHEQPPRMVQVELVAQWQRRQVTVTVRSRRSHRALFACTCIGARGAEFAMLSAERFCAERGYVLVMPPAHAPANDNQETTVRAGTA